MIKNASQNGSSNFELKAQGLEDDGLGLCTKVACERSVSGGAGKQHLGRCFSVADLVSEHWE